MRPCGAAPTGTSRKAMTSANFPLPCMPPTTARLTLAPVSPNFSPLVINSTDCEPLFLQGASHPRPLASIALTLLDIRRHDALRRAAPTDEGTAEVFLRLLQQARPV